MFTPIAFYVWKTKTFNHSLECSSSVRTAAVPDEFNVQLWGSHVLRDLGCGLGLPISQTLAGGARHLQGLAGGVVEVRHLYQPLPQVLQEGHVSRGVEVSFPNAALCLQSGEKSFMIIFDMKISAEHI